jgi:hypothetical protein
VRQLSELGCTAGHWLRLSDQNSSS